MKNPNDCTTTIRTSTDNLVIEYGYTSASVANHDFSSIQDTYSHAQSVSINGKIVTVIIPIITGVEA